MPTRVAIAWEKCSERLARATPLERSRAILSPSGYGIHWQLIDEDLAGGPLVFKGAAGANDGHRTGFNGAEGFFDTRRRIRLLA